MDGVFPRQALNGECIGISRSQWLLKDHVNLFGRTSFHDFEMAIVLHKRPHEIGPHFIQHLAVIAEEGNIGSAALLGFSDQIRNRFRNAHKLRVFTLEHSAQMSPDMRVDQADDGHLVFTRRA